MPMYHLWFQTQHGHIACTQSPSRTVLDMAYCDTYFVVFAWWHVQWGVFRNIKHAYCGKTRNDTTIRVIPTKGIKSMPTTRRFQKLKTWKCHCGLPSDGYVSWKKVHADAHVVNHFSIFNAFEFHQALARHCSLRLTHDHWFLIFSPHFPGLSLSLRPQESWEDLVGTRASWDRLISVFLKFYELGCVVRLSMNQKFSSWVQSQLLSDMTSQLSFPPSRRASWDVPHAWGRSHHFWFINWGSMRHAIDIGVLWLHALHSESVTIRLVCT